MTDDHALYIVRTEVVKFKMCDDIVRIITNVRHVKGSRINSFFD